METTFTLDKLISANAAQPEKTLLPMETTGTSLLPDSNSIVVNLAQLWKAYSPMENGFCSAVPVIPAILMLSMVPESSNAAQPSKARAPMEEIPSN
jgi:hypothetical protein